MNARRTATTIRRIRSRRMRTAPAVVLAGLVMSMGLTACSIEDAICGSDEYPVLYVGSAGGDCVPNGEEPPKGYVRYPAGKVPQHVDDKWDLYWNTHSVDENGKIIEVPDAA
ncbi:SCO0607 family lipoprotein [Streptomyces paludis]|uniref:Lipoprotein n=1 Tax=Streptomyces paludis TaxID=2282738 RepID=A0A345HQV8_9ACTN|nr:hypothetical protein [Streptomyces paludis]AXG79082.1 hypothetical protein DVK44_16885 [Streptomyces paludis]